MRVLDTDQEPTDIGFPDYSEFDLGLPTDNLIEAFRAGHGVGLDVDGKLEKLKGWNGRYASMNVAANRPLWADDAGGPDYPGFTGADSTDGLFTDIAPYAEGYICVGIKTPAAWGANGVFVGGYSSSGNVIALGHNTTGELCVNIGDKTFGQITLTGAMSLSTKYVVGMRWTATEAFQRRNKTARAAVTYGGTRGTAMFWLGERANNSLATTATMLDVFFYTGAHTTDMMDAIDDDMAALIGLTF